MRRAAAVRARQRKIREENANQEAESAITGEDSTPTAATNTKGGRNRKGGVSKQKETNTESEGVEGGQSGDGDSSEEQYEVEKIVDMKVIRGVKKYRIRWKGYDSESDTWEIADNLNCPNAVQEYLDQKSKSENVSVASPRKRASKADVVTEAAATNNIKNTENDTSSKDGEDMPPAKKRKSSKAAKPPKDDDEDENADDENEEEETEEKAVEEPPAKEETVKRDRTKAKGKKEETVSTEETENGVKDDETSHEEPPAKEETVKRGRTKAKAKKEETVSSEETENGVNTDEASYEVEKIMEVHQKKNGKKEYLIHWRGYPHSQDTWEPEEHLDCEELIREFEERANKGKDPNVRELRTERAHTNRFTEEQAAKRHSKRGKGKKRTTYYDTE